MRPPSFGLWKGWIIAPEGCLSRVGAKVSLARGSELAKRDGGPHESAKQTGGEECTGSRGPSCCWPQPWASYSSQRLDRRAEDLRRPCTSSSSPVSRWRPTPAG